MASKHYTILQGNLNHCWAAQQLLFQQMVELDAGLAVISEPANLPNNRCIPSKDGKPAIVWNNNLELNCALFDQGQRFVAMKIGKECIFSCYISPNVDLGAFQEFLDELNEAITNWGSNRIIVAGDFNAASPFWDSHRFNQRGDRLVDWAAELDLRLLNDVGVYTCIHLQGNSTVDLTWIAPDMLVRIIDWQVLDNETLSDHRQIRIKVYYESNYIHKNQVNETGLQVKWKMDKCKWDVFTETSRWLDECGPSQDVIRDVEYQAKWLESIMTSDASTPRIKKRYNARKSTYWWNATISDLRNTCIKNRRLWTRARGKKTPPEVNKLQAEYKQARKNMRDEIRNAKRKAWQDLLDALDRDPWGLSYRLVVGALKGPSKGLTETLDETKALNPLLDRLFPTGNQSPQLELSFDADTEITPNDRITQTEISQVLKRPKIKKAAPGLNGHIEKIWKMAPDVVIEKLVDLFNCCLINGVFPDCWKTARLVLIPKGNEKIQADSNEIKARPRRVLNEEGKIFERVILKRMYTIMKRNYKARLSRNQYGFTPEKSTTDALLDVRIFVERAMENGNAAVAVSLDIVNAFNSIPWKHIIAALMRKGFPNYLCILINNYLSDRKIKYMVAGGMCKQRMVEAGVPLLCY